MVEPAVGDGDAPVGVGEAPAVTAANRVISLTNAGNPWGVECSVERTSSWPAVLHWVSRVSLVWGYVVSRNSIAGITTHMPVLSVACGCRRLRAGSMRMPMFRYTDRILGQTLM